MKNEDENQNQGRTFAGLYGNVPSIVGDIEISLDERASENDLVGIVALNILQSAPRGKISIVTNPARLFSTSEKISLYESTAEDLGYDIGEFSQGNSPYLATASIRPKANAQTQNIKMKGGALFNK